MMNNPTPMSEAAREAQRRYNREWYAKNRERVQAQRAARWERKAAEEAKKAHQHTRNDFPQS